MRAAYGIFLCFGIVLTATRPGLSQEHAPTVAQCTADKRLWTSQLTDYLNAEAERMNHGTINSTEILKLSMREVAKRAGEMVDCQAVDSINSSDYLWATKELNNAYDHRFILFVERHHLTQQLLNEDGSGIR